MWKEIFTSTSAIIALITLCGAAIYAGYQIWKDWNDFKNVRIREAEEKDSLTKIVNNLSSEASTSRISAAIMLRRFLQTEISEKYPHLQTEAINIIASLLKILPSGVLQKTLADGLAYGIDLSYLDLQKSNLQDVYLGRKDDNPILMGNTDLYMSDLSYALVENAQGNAIFYRSILYRTKFKKCNFENANFSEADLSHITFKDVYLTNADFTRAKNIPDEIKCHLVERNGREIYADSKAVTAYAKDVEKVIFMSVPSIMNKEDELLTKDYKTFLNNLGFQVIYYVRDDYPQFGQLGKIKEQMLTASGMIVFGFKQTLIQKATYRPNTDHEEVWSDKWLSTPWNEIEVGMAIMRGLPIMMVKDPSIENGIFDSHLSECFVSNLLTDIDSRRLADNKEMNNWLSRIE